MAKNKEIFEYQAKISVDAGAVGQQINQVRKALQDMEVNIKIPKGLREDLIVLENKFYEMQKATPGAGSSKKDLDKYSQGMQKLAGELSIVSEKMRALEIPDSVIQKNNKKLQNLLSKIKAAESELESKFAQESAKISKVNEGAMYKKDIGDARKSALVAAEKGKKADVIAAFSGIKDKTNAKIATLESKENLTEFQKNELAKAKISKKNIETLEEEILVLTEAQKKRQKRVNNLRANYDTKTQEIKTATMEQYQTAIEPLAGEQSRLKNIVAETEAQAEAQGKIEESAKAFDITSQKIKNLFSATTVFYTVRRVIQGAIRDFQELDKQFNEIAIVSDYSTEEMWKGFGKVNKIAQEFGVTTKNVLEVQNLYYHQGKDMAEVNKLTAQTLTLAKITGMDYERATSDLTAALNAYNIAAEDAVIVTDSIAAMDTNAAISSEELMTALTKTASIAANAGMSLQSTEVFLTKMIETTREAPENLGTALKTIIARFGEVKQEIDGEEIELADINKVDTALKGIGISLLDTAGQIRDLDDVFMELSAKWDDLDRNTQRYIATQAAGSRQQSRFIAMMEDYDRTLELTDIAQNSAGLGARQLAESMDSIETSMNRLKSTWQEFYANIINAGWIKDGIDAVNGVLTGLNKLNDFVPGLGLIVGALGLWGAKILIVDMGLKALGKTIGEGIIETSAYKGAIDLQMSAMTSATLAEIAENEALEENIRLKAKAILATKKLADAENEAATSQAAGNMTDKPSLIKRLWNTMKEGASKNGEIDNLYGDFKNQKIFWKNGLLSDKEFKAQRAATRQQAKASLKGGLTKTFEPKLQKFSKVLGATGKTIKTLGHILGITAKGFAATTGAIAGLTIAVTAAIWAWKKYGKASYDDTEKIKKLNEAQEKYNSSLKEQNAIKKNYKTYAKYESKGALSAEEMEEQQAAAKALVDEYPHLLDYIDDEGNYHLKNTSLIEAEINAKEELLKKNADLYTQQRLSASRDGIYSDTSTRAGAAIKKIQDFSAAYDEDQLKKSGREIDSFGVTFDNSRYKKMMQAFAEGKKYSFDEKDMSNLFAGQISASNWEEFLEKVQENPEILESQESLTEALDSTGAYIEGGAERVAKAFLQMDKANGQLFSELIKGAAEELSEIRVLQAEVIIENGNYEVDLTAEMKETLAKVAAGNVEKQIEEMSDLERFFLSDKKEQEMIEEEAERLASAFENLTDNGLTKLQKTFTSENLGGITYGKLTSVNTDASTSEEKKKVVKAFYNALDEDIKKEFPEEYVGQMSDEVIETLFALIINSIDNLKLTGKDSIGVKIWEEFKGSKKAFESPENFSLTEEDFKTFIESLTLDQIKALQSNFSELDETEKAPYLNTIIGEYSKNQNPEFFNALMKQDFSTNQGIAAASLELQKFGYTAKETYELAIKAMNGVNNISMSSFEDSVEEAKKSLESMEKKLEGVTALLEGTGSFEQVTELFSTAEAYWKSQGDSADSIANKMEDLSASIVATGEGFKIAAEGGAEYANMLTSLQLDTIQQEIGLIKTKLNTGRENKTLSTEEVLNYKKEVQLLALEYARIDAASKKAVQDGLKKDLEEAKEKAIELRDAIKDLVNWLLEFDRHQNLDRVLETLDYEFGNLEFQIDFSTNADVIADSILSQFENTNTQLAVNNANLNAARDQKAMMRDTIEKNYSQYASFDESGNVIVDAAQLQQLQETIAKLKQEGKEGEAEVYQNIYDTLMKTVDGYDTATKKEREYAKNRQDNLKTIAELEKQMLQNIVDEQDMVIEAIKEREDRELELVQEKYEAIDKENDKYLDSIQKMVDEERRIRDQANSEQDIKDKEKKLAMMKMDTSGIYAKDIRSLEKELEKDYQKLEDNAVDTAIDKISQQYEADAEAREKELEYWNNYLEEKRRTGTEYYEEYYRIAAGGSDRVVEFMKQNDQEYLSSSKEKQALFEKEWSQTCAKAEGSNEVLGTSLYNQVATNLTICQGSALGFDGAVTQYSDNVKVTTGPIKGNISSMATEYGKLAGGVQGVNTKIGEMGSAFWNAANASSALEKSMGVIVGMLPDMTEALKNINEALKAAEGFEKEANKNKPKAYTGATDHYIGDTSNVWEPANWSFTGGVKYDGNNNPLYYEVEDKLKVRENAWVHKDNIILDANNKPSRVKVGAGLWKFAQGGYVDFTGPAWVDGTKSHPEYMLNATQTAQFETLVDALSMMYKTPNFSQTKVANAEKTGDTRMEFHINVDGISSDYDVDKAVERIEKKILDSGKYRNTTVLKNSN